MAQSIVIHGLVSKRAELSGEISEAEKRLERLRADLDSLDATIRLSDPTVAPKTIKPRVKRTGRSRSRSGELTRTTLSILRQADRPLSVREIAAQVAAECPPGHEHDHCGQCGSGERPGCTSARMRG